MTELNPRAHFQWGEGRYFRAAQARKPWKCAACDKKPPVGSRKTCWLAVTGKRQKLCMQCALDLLNNEQIACSDRMRDRINELWRIWKVRTIYAADDERAARLRAKCRWEHMTPGAVLREWPCFADDTCWNEDGTPNDKYWGGQGGDGLRWDKKQKKFVDAA